jgi:hypothetical protein
LNEIKPITTADMKTCRPATKSLTHALSLCAGLFAAAFLAPQAGALDIAGLIKVNGNEMPGVLIAVYDCADGSVLGQTYSGATDASSGTPLNYAISVPTDNVRIELYYHPTPESVPLAEWCRDFVLCGEIVPSNGEALVSVDMTCVSTVPAQPGVAGPGFWKRHPREWPVNVITIGGRSFHRLPAIILMCLPERGDKTKAAFRQLAAAKLNVLAGNDDSCIAESIAAADAWLARYPVCSGVRASSAAWKKISRVIERLEAYNSGRLCVPSRDCDDRDDDHERD